MRSLREKAEVMSLTADVVGGALQREINDVVVGTNF